MAHPQNRRTALRAAYCFKAQTLEQAAEFTFFRRTYFPHYCTVAGDSMLHTWLDQTLPRMADTHEGAHIALAAPRGEAKSTFISLFFVLWCVLTGRKRYILIIADALEQAAMLLEAVKAELDSNPRLAMDFPNASGRGRVWNVGTILTAQNVKLQAPGATDAHRPAKEWSAGSPGGVPVLVAVIFVFLEKQLFTDIACS